MGMGFLRHIRTKADHLAFGSGLYNWSLSGHISQGFATALSDTWPGNPEQGRWLCQSGSSMDWEFRNPAETEPEWLRYIHGFEWLRDLKALGGDQARLQARDMVISWIRHNTACRPALWRPDFTGRRVASWIAFYDFFGASADDDFQEHFFTALARQARHLSRSVASAPPGLHALDAIRGLAYAGIALDGRESWLTQALNLLQTEAEKQILPDGGHVSRSPDALLRALQIFIDIRTALSCGDYPVPARLEHVIDRMAQALRFFRYADRRFAVFHGAQEGNTALIDCVLMRSNARGKILRGLPQTGFERLTLGRSLVMVDCGAPPARPYDRTAHASPLGFEFIYGKERVFVSCGAHPFDPAWQDSLRATAAHNALTLNDRNSCEIRDDGHFGRRVRKITVTRDDSKHAALIEAVHDGYVPLNGVTHRRRLFLGSSGHDFRGEDTLTCSIDAGRPVAVALRFHLHPRVLVSLIRDGQEALLRLPGGAGWRFVHGSGTLSLENSLYLGEGTRPRKTKQLVISGMMDTDHAQIKWALQREGR